MGIGIIGAGAIGAAFARRAAHADIQAILSNSRGPDSLAELISAIGGTVRAGTREEAAAQDIVLVAVSWSKLAVALSGLPDFGGRILVDANNPIEPPIFIPADLGGRSSTEVFGGYVTGAKIAKAFNHLPARLLAEDPRAAGGRRVLFFAGSDPEAKAEIAALIDKLGFFGIDLGAVNDGGRAINIPGGALAVQNLVRLD